MAIFNSYVSLPEGTTWRMTLLLAGYQLGLCLQVAGIEYDCVMTAI